MQITIEVEESVVKQLKGVAQRKDQTLVEAAAGMLEKGVKDFCYRVKRNEQVYQQQKALRARSEEILKRAEELGLLDEITAGEGDE